MIGRVIKNLSNTYNVLLEDNTIINLKARGKIKYRGDDIKVGDFVECTDTINKILDRKNSFIRPLISNVDYVIIITSLKKPDINYELLDKFIVNIEKENTKAILVFTKCDLLDDKELKRIKDINSYYAKYYPVYYSKKEGLIEKESFFNLISNKVCVFTGQTGAGKSNLLNSFDTSLNLKTQEISDSLNRGKHTTRYTELIKINNSYIADTPGFSSLDLSEIYYKDLKNYYVEFSDHLNKCRFDECSHTHEPDCIIKKLVDDGSILKTRYISYLKFYDELKLNDFNKYKGGNKR